MSVVTQSTTIHDDVLLPVEPAARRLARAIYDEIAGAPIVSPHGHVDAQLIADDAPVADPAALLVTTDHYVLRLLHATGLRLHELGLRDRAGVEPTAAPREVWRRFAERSHVFEGTTTGLWLQRELRSLFDLALPDAHTADDTFDAISERLAEPEFRPRALIERAGVSVITTTDPAGADLTAHTRLRDAAFRVLPTLRPDAVVDPSAPGWRDRVEALISESPTYSRLLAALRSECARFRAAGATAVDLGLEEPRSAAVSASTAQRLFQRAIDGSADPGELDLLRAALTHELARMCESSGLTLMIHAGVLRGHHRPTTERFGPDTGHDLPVPTSFLGLRSILEELGTSERFRLVLFTVDEAAWAREIVPLAGFYPAVYAGAPWWFLDSPDAMLRFRSVLTEGAGFGKYSGFIDDARSLCSISVRHDIARRTDARFFARFVAEGRLTLDRAVELAKESVDALPRRVFGL